MSDDRFIFFNDDFDDKWFDKLNDQIHKKIKEFEKANKNGASKGIFENQDTEHSGYKELKEDPMYDSEGLKKRSDYYSDLYKAYVEYYENKCNQNLKLKNKFFRNFMAFLAWIIVIIPAFVIVIIVTKKGVGSAEVICAVSGSAATIVTSIIVIPKIIAKYLFSTKEDKVISDLLKDIQTHDIETRKNYIEKQ